MPRIEDLAGRLHGYQYFTSLDLESRYYQIAMKHPSVNKTAFITDDGHYEFLGLPFGSANAPSSFQQMGTKTGCSVICGLTMLYEYYTSMIY